PGPASPDNGEARVSSAEAARACATPCSSAPWSLRVTTRSSKASATNLSPPESQSSSLSSPSPASSSLSSTRYCEIDAHGSKSPLDRQDSRSVLQPAKTVSKALTPDTARQSQLRQAVVREISV